MSQSPDASSPTSSLPDSLLTGENAAFLDQQYLQWQEDPASVEAAIRATFEAIEGPPNGRTGQGPSFQSRSIFAPAGVGTDSRQAKVVQLINAYRVRAHLSADVDPLGRKTKVVHDELDLGYYGLSDADLDDEFDTSPMFGMPARATLRTIVGHLRKAYCGAIGAEFMNIMDNEQKHWVQEQLETLPNRGVIDPTEERRVFRKLCDAENFERMLHTRFPGTKRFSLEGGETLIPLLDLLIERAGTRGVREIVFGMAHRGRLNTLVNILRKPALLVVREFEGQHHIEGSGDVKYHLGYSADVQTVGGDIVHLSVTPNPSHLEAVNGVVEGRVRAKQDRDGENAQQRAMAVLLHGDAAFAGQGSVTEVLNLSELKGYRTGGTVHIIVNNQIGFTTAPAEGRSTEYATDVARMLAVPIFHVNGEHPRAVAAVIQMAMDYRQRFHRDVIVDMYCYRKHGHNEGDEPSFTQPMMYDIIRSRPTPREVYAQHLVRIGTLSPEECDKIHEESYTDMQAAATEPEPMPTAPAHRRELQMKGDDPDQEAYFSKPEITMETDRPRVSMDSPLKGLWEEYSSGHIDDEVETGFDLDRMLELLRACNTIPEGFEAHAKIKRLFTQRMRIVNGEQPVDWAIGEQAAWATLLHDGYRVRLSGQDSGRGTFSHRHAVITDVKTGDEYYPLKHVVEGGHFDAIDSSLSELAVLGFEVGYSFDTPDGLVMWEAQFGDFANGAQMIVDQFMASCEQKWGRYCGTVMLLPHGYEGQGPEHSSARLERYLIMCAEDNIQVANCTTPASFFHLLRRQVIRRVRKPLLVMTPKSLLRHPLATSTLEELANGRFRPVLPEVDDLEPSQVKRLVLCSGKVYYELLRARREAEQTDVAIARMEQLYPFPKAQLEELGAQYPGAELVWCQEEPKNMGAWPQLLHWFLEHLPMDRLPRYVGRPAAASPATGSHQKHLQEQSALVTDALRF